MKYAFTMLGLTSVARALFSPGERQDYEPKTIFGGDQLYLLTDLELEDAMMDNNQENLNSQRSRIFLCYESSEKTDGPKCERWEFTRLDAQADSESEERKCALWEAMESGPEFDSARQEWRYPTELNAFLESHNEERSRKAGKSTEFDSYFGSESQERTWVIWHRSDADAKLNSESENRKNESKHSTESDLDFDSESVQNMANREMPVEKDEKDVYDPSHFSCFFGSLDLGDKTLFLASDDQMRGFVSLNKGQFDPNSSESRFRAQELIQNQLKCPGTEENSYNQRTLTILSSKLRTDVDPEVEFKVCDFFYPTNNKPEKQQRTSKVDEKSHIQPRLLSALTIPGYQVESEVTRTASTTNHLLDLISEDDYIRLYYVNSDEKLESYEFLYNDSSDSESTIVIDEPGTIEDINASMTYDDFIVTYVIANADNKKIYGDSTYGHGLIKELNTTTELTISGAYLEYDEFIIVFQNTSVDGDSSYGIAGLEYWFWDLEIQYEFDVNSYTTNDQIRPKVTSLAESEFIVAWQSYLQDGSSYGIYAQKFDFDGNKIGSEFQLSDDGNYSQEDVDIEGLSSSGYAAVWVRDSGSEKRIECRTDSSSIILVDTNTQTGTESVTPSVAALNNDEFIVTWVNKAPGSDYGTIYIQKYDASANPDGGIIEIATNAKLPYVANFADDSYAIAWINDSNNVVSHAVIKCSVDNCDSCPSDFSTCSNCTPGFYLDGNTCEACPDSNCIECSDASTCNDCNVGFLPNGSACDSCTSPCFDCTASGSDQCTMCSANSLPSDPPGSCDCTSPGACKCTSGYYESSSNPFECSACHSSCSECDGPLETDCTSCLDSSRTPTSPKGVCECPSGTFETTSSPVTCPACHSSCQECTGDQQNQCITCKDGRTPTSSPGYCTCPSGTYEHTMNPLNCVDCDPECTECTQPHRCTACKNELVLEDGVCKCPTGYLLLHTDLKCYECPDNCEECYCEGCENGYNSNGLICTSCLHGYFLSSGKCDVGCSDNCAKCVKQDLCTECNYTFVLNSSGSCECPDENYTITDGECVYTSLSYDIEDRRDYYLISFSQNLRTDLTAKNMICEFLPSNTPFSFHVEPYLDSSRRLESAGSQYRLTIDAETIPEGTTTISIEFKDIVSVSGNTIRGSNLNLTLEAEKTRLEQKLDSSTNRNELLEDISVKAAAYVAVFVGTAVSLVTALISRNGGYVWTFVNTIYLIYYMPLQNLGMTTTMKSFFKHMNIYYLGVSEISLDIYDSEDSLENWFDHDLETTNLIHNLKYTLFGAFLGGVVLVCLLVLRCCKGSNKFVENRIIDLKWNYFYRLWILTFINVVVAGVLSTGNVRFT